MTVIKSATGCFLGFVGGMAVLALTLPVDMMPAGLGAQTAEAREAPSGAPFVRVPLDG